MKPSEVKKIKLAPDEALVVVFKGNPDDLANIRAQEVRRHMAEHIPNADLARIVVLLLDENVELDITQIKMEKT